MKEHENGSLNLSRIHIGLNNTEDRIINYIYLKDNNFYSLGESILKWSEQSHTEIPREKTLKTLKWASRSFVRFLHQTQIMIANTYTHAQTHGMHGKVSL